MDADLLATRAFGLRFIDADTEHAYRRWYLVQAVPFCRVALIASALGWVLTWLGTAFGIPGTGGPMAIWIFGAMFPLLAVAWITTFRPNLTMLWANASANVIAGWVGIGVIAYGQIKLVEASALGCIVIGSFCFTVFRLPPEIAAPSVLSYVTLHQVLAAHSHALGDIDTRRLVVDSVLPWVAFSMGLIVCCVIERLSRESFRRERVIDAQTRLIAAEQERSERLLRNILPDAIAERLKQADGVIADDFDEVSVLFVDIVGFTPLASGLGPHQVVDLLNEVFSAFDELTTARGVEKIKTIGDAYMAVAGLPVPRADHAEVIADLALDMRGALQSLRDRTGHAISFRIGLASGPVVAGVIGRSKFAYDLWGHTVNMAARMESHGEAERIHVTDAVHDRLVSTHRLEPRGEVDIKGAGCVHTWFLEGRMAP